MPPETNVKPVEAAARELHLYAVEGDPELPAWDDIPADVRDRYMACAKRMLKAAKAAKKAKA